ncbi:MAG: VOC family protein [Fimbriimonadaceae bacterium]|nr:MAG: VOC family protein [Fimbriimonadaceae bacterium]
MSNVVPIPEGFNTITAYLIVDGADAAIELYKKALGAEVMSVHKMPDGKVLNAQLRIGSSMLMLNDEWPDWGAIGPKKIGNTAVTMHLYVEDVDAAWQRAVDAGFEVSMPLDNAPWGDRYGSLKDPFGHSWSMATHIEDVSEEELMERFKNMPM